MTPSSSSPLGAARRLIAGAVVAAFVAACAPASGGSSTPAATPGQTEAAAQLGELQVIAKIPVPDAFDVVEAFGSIWVASNDSGVVTRIDPATNAAVATIQVSTFVASLAPTDDGLWTIDGDAKSIRRIDPKTNKLTTDSIAIGDDGGSLQFAQGAMWQSGHGAAQRIDLKARTTEHFALPCDDCYLVILGDAGYAVGSASISRVDLASHQPLATNDSDTAGQLVAVDTAGLWVGAKSGGVALLDPQSLALEKSFTAAPASADGTPFGLGAAGENGSIVTDASGAWVRFSAPVLGHVKTADGKVSLYGPFPASAFGASGFIVADGSIWLTNSGGAPGSDETGSVWRLALPAS